jgi:hypothetical protein
MRARPGTARTATSRNPYLEETMTHTRLPLLAALPLAAALLAGCGDERSYPQGLHAATLDAAAAAAVRTFPVAGTAVHFLSTAVVHSQQPVDGGLIQRSTEVIVLAGDLQGYILYHPTSVFDFVAGTLVNTGTQVFSGTVAGSPPVLLHDDVFRFDVDLATGETIGRVVLGRSGDTPHPGTWYECELVVIGTGMTSAGDATVDYSGECTQRGSAG